LSAVVPDFCAPATINSSFWIGRLPKPNIAHCTI
jgi:hypothetical protein